MRFELEKDVSFAEAFRAAAGYLKARGIGSPDPDLALLIENASGLSGTSYYMRRTEKMPEEARCCFAENVSARGTGIPVQQILREAWFYGRRFYVDDSVLVPRMDTEVLVGEALRDLRAGSNVLDLCTGSGCIILTLVLEAGVKGAGSDISPQALAVAEKNEAALQAECTWIRSDLFENIRDVYDMIVSNPPYIRTAEISRLDKEVREHEPHLALDGGEDGLAFYRKIAAEAERHLRPAGKLLLEIGYDQGRSVPRILAENGWNEIEMVRDLAGHPRVVRARRP